jgi:hypothetical protein
LPEETLGEIKRDLDVHRHLLRLQILRILSPRGWHPNIQCEGVDHLHQALSLNKGVILWMSHFIYTGLVGKIGLNEHGFNVNHVSRPEHGFSKTLCGIHTINRIRVRAEDQYLASRVLINRNAVCR